MGRYGALGWSAGQGATSVTRALEALEQVGMADFADRQISQLSGGQQQRVFLARALVQDARVYLMDEPFQGVDATTERAIVDAAAAICAPTARRSSCVHHDLQTVAEYFDWVDAAERPPHRQRPGGGGVHRREPAADLRWTRRRSCSVTRPDECRPADGDVMPRRTCRRSMDHGFCDLFFDYTLRTVALGAATLGHRQRRAGVLRGAAAPEPARRCDVARGTARHCARLPAHGSKAPLSLLLGAVRPAGWGRSLVMAMSAPRGSRTTAALGTRPFGLLRRRPACC